MNYPILILAYRRVSELISVIESVKQLNPSVIYFHLHDAPTAEQQLEVNEVKKVISMYEGRKEVKYTREPLGVRKSMYSALQWIAEKEPIFLVFEDDVVLKDSSFSQLNAGLKKLKEEGGILKFGPHPKIGVFWGWATDANTALKIVNTNIQELPYSEIGSYFENKYHYLGLMEMFKKEMHQAWDDEFHMIAKVTGINIIETETELTEIISTSSTRTDNGIDKGFGEGSHIMFVNGQLVE